jgi:hypothetical protein
VQPGNKPTVSPEGVICTTDHAFRGEDFHALWEYMFVNLPITGYTGGPKSDVYFDKLYEI